jgi:hypothetical protein
MHNIDDKKKFLIKSYEEKKISKEYFEKELDLLEESQVELNIQKRLKENPTLSYENGHFSTHLICPKCKSNGIVSHLRNDFKMLGKDKEGFIFFECPNCKTHIKWDSITGSIKSNKGILGFLFNKFA